MASQHHSSRFWWCRGIRPILLLPYFASLFAVSRAQGSSQAAFASVSIASDRAYVTARPCAAGCLVYNGIWVCGLHSGYDDLAKELGCGCSPINACYCNADFASSATSYVSSCVSNACGSSVDDWREEAAAMLTFYNGYCATADITTTSGAWSQSGGAIQSSSSRAAPLTPVSTGSSTANPGAVKPENDESLSKSDVIALAASLGVGIPGLLIAMVTLCVQLRKRRADKITPVAVSQYGTGWSQQESWR